MQHERIPIAEHLARGRAAREEMPRSTHAEFSPIHRDPVAILEGQHALRRPDLIPLRMARMQQSPFAFYRGTAALMAHDLASERNTGQMIMACGDAHIGNFGVFATPERTVTFELNDFDESSTAPWEWDVKRLAASIVLAGLEIGLTSDQTLAEVKSGVRTYAKTLRTLLKHSALERFYQRIDTSMLTPKLDADERTFITETVQRARSRTSDHLLPRITASHSDGDYHIVPSPPVLFRDPDVRIELARELMAGYRMTARVDVAFLLDQFELTDIAFRVVGVGSVGLRCYILLFRGPAGEPLFLQVKEATPSVLETYGSVPNRLREIDSIHSNHEGFRVITAQRIMQTASDPFLGFLTHAGADFYVRQFRDMKASIDLDQLNRRRFHLYVTACAAQLGRSHAQNAAAPFISGYVGKGGGFAEAIAAWASAYAAQVHRDYTALREAISSGRLPASELT
ncbi:MAG: DUF2252 domain-containing protein [Thermomicrobiales bacterium]|nr:DUF2252 domain-containing protein [Thermomicrobiales bacterium]